MKKLTLDALPVPPVRFALEGGAGGTRHFHLRPFSVADEQFLSEIKKPFVSPVDTLAVVLRQFATPYELGDFCEIFDAPPPASPDAAGMLACAKLLAPSVPQHVLDGAMGILINFRLMDQQRLKEMDVGKKKQTAPRWRTLMFCAFASGLGGALAMFLACRWWSFLW